MSWKWITLSLHSALYGFAICACRGTNNLIVVKTNKKGLTKLISFDEAIKNCQNVQIMKKYIYSKHLELTEKQKESIKMLKQELRNNFEHYQPMSWSIEIHGLPQIFIDVLDIIKFLAIETGNIIHLNKYQIKKIKLLINKSKYLLRNTKLYKEIKNN